MFLSIPILDAACRILQTEAFAQRCSEKKALKKIRCSEKFTGKHLCQRGFFNRVADRGRFSQVFLKLQTETGVHRCFALSFAEFLGKAFL